MKRRLFFVFVALGLYLTLRGYHSRDGDQAYRLPLLLARQAPSLYKFDPFVRAFDVFNPHRGYLSILDLTSRVVGLSAALAILFAATFALTCLAIDTITRAAWPESGGRVGVWAVALVLIAKAGNLGTNHLFEAMLLDRLMALALGWGAMAAVVGDPAGGRKWAAFLVGLAAIVHPSLGIQIGLILAGGQVVWAIWGGVDRKSAIIGAIAMLAALAPGWALVAGQSGRLMEGLPEEEFLTLAASIQSPQHMLPHLWRMPQWLAGGAYLVLAGLAIGSGPRSAGRDRLAVNLGVCLAFLLVGWVAVEVVHSAKATLFQPFRMATLARGICLVLAADRVRGLWARGDAIGRVRALMIAVGVSSDWLMVAAVAIELSATLGGRFGRLGEVGFVTIAWVWGAVFLSRHDTEFGHWMLFLAAGTSVVVGWVHRRGRRNPPYGLIASLAWIVPVVALIAPSVSHGRIAARLAEHCRFGEWAGDDIERLAAWSRTNTPGDARFITPPGPKTFRLWSRREVAFNRSASPYHAAGIADWAERFRDHVDFHGTNAEFAAMYLKDRQALEAGFDRMGEAHLAELACREGAAFVLASSRLAANPVLERLEPLRIVGRYAIYRVKAESERAHGPPNVAVSRSGDR